MLLVYIWPPLKCRLYLVCAIWAHKPLARWLHYHLLNSWILWVLIIPGCHVPGCGAVVGLWRWKGACDLYQLLDKSTSTSPCYLICVKVFSAQILSYSDWKHFATDICGASHHMSLHNISFFFTSRFLSVLFFLGKQFWCLKILALNSLLADFLQRSSWQNCLLSCQCCLMHLATKMQKSERYTYSFLFPFLIPIVSQ